MFRSYKTDSCYLFKVIHGWTERNHNWSTNESVCSDQSVTVEFHLCLISGESKEHVRKHEEPSRSNTSLWQPHLQKRQQGHLTHLLPRLRTHTGKDTHSRKPQVNTHQWACYSWTWTCDFVAVAHLIIPAVKWRSFFKKLKLFKWSTWLFPLLFWASGWSGHVGVKLW